MTNDDDKYLSRPGFEPGTLRLQAPVDTNETSGPATQHVTSLNQHWTSLNQHRPTAVQAKRQILPFAFEEQHSDPENPG